MTPDGRIANEFDDVTIDREPGEPGEEQWDEFDDLLDQSPESDDRDDDLADLELVVLALAGTTVLGTGLAGFSGRPSEEPAEQTATDGLRPVPGAEHLIHRLRSTGVRVALVADLSRPTMDAVLDAVGWRHLADVTLSPAEAGRGRPFPDQPLTALLRTGASSVEGMVVVGDTAEDIAAGIAAGAGLVVGVLTGTHDEQALLDAGADAVLPSVADLPALLGFDLPAQGEHDIPTTIAPRSAFDLAEGSGAR